MKIASWNLLYRAGASHSEISNFLEDTNPDILLMQEAKETIVQLSDRTGGTVHYHPWPGKTYGMAIWCSEAVEQELPITLPKSALPGSFPVRSAQTMKFNNVTIANVHLSHGQLLNRRQLKRIAINTAGPTVIMGDFNAVGPTILRDFKDVGPRAPTHRAQRVMPLRLDRCLVRGLECERNEVHETRGSDHHPIIVRLKEKQGAQTMAVD